MSFHLQWRRIQISPAPTLYYSAYTSSSISSQLLSITNYLSSSSQISHLQPQPTHQLHQHQPSIPSIIIKPNLLPSSSPSCPSHPTKISLYPRHQTSFSQALSSGSLRDSSPQTRLGHGSLGPGIRCFGSCRGLQRCHRVRLGDCA